ncbi:MAG: SsrA-binding protein [Candidatus Hydrogenedentes bacterium ADurb.Bin101]|jgi:SsrA-binding protein|nr:MAG: SsrA-binding protein [Candidatus Hydrogenedentes bacterium ADurb.Bin101]HOC67710.1 SsrA-binding protein SmpB [Candidatus Hydrogenedentota bacterium]
MNNIKIITKNRNAYHEYHVLEKIEAGITLRGTEVKSIRENSAISLKESYVDFLKGEAWLIGCRVSPYKQGNINNHDPERARKLLLHKRELNKLARQVAEKGITIVPLAAYFKQGKVKIEIGLCRGKRLYDKRDTIKQREADREMERAVKHRR